MMVFTTMVCRKRKTETVPVYLNVYDITPINGYAYWLGLGLYHSGVQVHGVEYAFGAHDRSTSGIFEVEPKKYPGFTFRKSILIGKSDLGVKEVGALMAKLAKEYLGTSYNLITKNCNHFCNDVCLRLTGKSIPRWVNRLARLGLFCNCVLPTGLHETKVCHIRSEDTHSEKKKLKSRSSRSVSTSDPQAFSNNSSINSSAKGIGSTRSCRHRTRHSSPSLSSSSSHL